MTKTYAKTCSGKTVDRKPLLTNPSFSPKILNFGCSMRAQPEVLTSGNTSAGPGNSDPNEGLLGD